ncbi:MAG: CDP-alcohol phosphatidyltransferase family protein [Dehalococcoidia bacterium]|nr:CDP-alcohol phosphatidyltransferase family protein [Dehalococcoidia bacterium]NUQ56563.1 CDP-alcohol phosphatidyltransferase family protein [Dehalococcoidia bacterium]RIL01537.1 MAG: CDP-alcohol phosphatidyltransferase family protein [bacterium]
MPGLNLLPQKVPRNIADPLGRAVARLGITPNMVSLFGFGGNVVAAWLITREELLAAGCVFLFFSALDLVDGAVARATNQATPFGAVFDAVLDRASEALVLVACAWYFAAREEHVQVVLSWAALVGSVAVSYMRARAEMLGISMRDGFFRRQERVALLGIGLLFDALTVVIWPLAVLSNLTALQRLWMVARELRQPASQA